MSLISNLHFSSKNIKNLQDLEQDNEALVVDFSSKGINHPAIMEKELNVILPKKLSEYTKEVLINAEESQLVLLSSDFISDCADLKTNNLDALNERINQSLNNDNLRQIRKIGIDNLPRTVRLISGVLLACSIISYFGYGRILISISFLVILIIYLLQSLKSYGSKRKKQVDSKQYNLIPQLQELASTCKQAKEKGLSAFYYWSL